MLFRELFWKNLHPKENNDQYLFRATQEFTLEKFYPIFMFRFIHFLKRSFIRNTKVVCNLETKKFQ